MKRREFIAGLGSVAACPVLGRAQNSDRDRMRGIRRAGTVWG